MPLAQMRMLVDPASRVDAAAAERAYLTGLDQIPWPTRAHLAGGQLLLERAVSDSGRLHIPFQVEHRGELMLATGTLMQRDRPYYLEVELARGKLNQVRNQLAEWLALGLVVTPSVESALRRALEEFTLAVTVPEDQATAAGRARHAIELAVEAGELLIDCYVEQASALRMKQLGRLPTLLGIHLGHRLMSPTALAQVSGAFNALVVSMLWRDVESQEGQYNWQIADGQIEWCQQHGVRALSGPLLRLDANGLPDWLSLWEGDFDSFIGFVCDYVSKVVARYRGKVALWQCAARINGSKVMSLHEEQVLQLAVRTLEVTREIDPETPTFIRFDQPWGEYLRHGEFDLSPLHFADALVRAGLQLSGIGLEINVGYVPNGSTARDRLDFSRLLDLWSCLGLPLHLMLSFPTGTQPDPKARNGQMPPPHEGSWTPEGQATWIKRFVPLMFAKSYVSTITWSQLSDAETHEYAHGGLFDGTGAAKPAFMALAGLRKKYLP
ncbi:MAG TPA: endo-1,4-beta-xylanase [Pirellulales bacterium]|jgi:hypothetical protein|nr:endo-1,4-beta-xylanase [Pirellulales bacterium]